MDVQTVTSNTLISPLRLSWCPSATRALRADVPDLPAASRRGATKYSQGLRGFSKNRRLELRCCGRRSGWLPARASRSPISSVAAPCTAEWANAALLDESGRSPGALRPVVGVLVSPGLHSPPGEPAARRMRTPVLIEWQWLEFGMVVVAAG